MGEEPMTEGADGIAIIGMSGRFPGAPGIREFWENLKRGVESITAIADTDLRASGIDPDAVSAYPNYVKARAVLDDVDQFDAEFFGIHARESALMDPQHRVFLECSWEALEDAGYDPQTTPHSIGVYAGLSMNTYLLANICADREFIQDLVTAHQLGSFQTFLGNDKDFLPSRVSYKLNLRGPSVNVQTACSTSLVAIAQACQGLLTYGCDMALAGGVSISFPQHRGYLYQEGGMGSADGHCRPFDANAGGTVFGGGVGVVVLKRLEDALADGDCIHAVIKGSAVNNDGAGKVSYTAPSVDGQAEVIAMAQAAAGVDAESITYVEAHGTATPLGDPIEIAALTQAFRAGTDRKGFCAIGSVKSNVGHLESAAGVTALIKTVLSLEHRLIPPTLHYQQPNPHLNLEYSPFYVNASLSEWPNGAGPRRAGVSSFGVGGTNAHVVLEEAPPVEPSSPSRPAQILILSARTGPALETATDNLAAYLQANPAANLADVAFTLQAGRRAFPHRRMIICEDAESAARALLDRDPKKLSASQQDSADRKDRPVAFLFPGQGSQYVDMGRQLYNTESVFRSQVDLCCDILRPHLELDLRTLLFPEDDQREAAMQRLGQTCITQPALFVIEYALAQQWMAWGISPRAMIGHSIGEYVCACLAGVFSLEDALALLAARGRMMQQLPPGAMLAVRLPEDELRPLLGDNLSLAAVNGPTLCVASGPAEVMKDLQKTLEERGIASRPLHTSHAFHSAMMDPIIGPFTELVERVRLNAPKIPYLSGVTGDWITSAEAMDPAYWARHFREPVRFATAAAKLLENPETVLLEVGPGRALSTMVRSVGQAAGRPVFTSLRHADEQRPDMHQMLNALGQLWLQGVAIDWAGFYNNERRQRVSLPTYPFERQRCWIDPPARHPQSTSPHTLPAHYRTEGNEIPMNAAETNRTPDGSARTDPPRSTRKDRVIVRLQALLHDLSGLKVNESDLSTTFLELGFDSLFLTQASQAFQKEFKVKVSFRQLLEDLPTLQELAGYIDEKLPPEALPDPAASEIPAVVIAAAAQPAPAIPAAISPESPSSDFKLPLPPAIPQHSPANPAAGATTLERIMAQQLQVMAQQIELLRGSGIPAAPVSAAAPALQPAANGASPASQNGAVPGPPVLLAPSQMDAPASAPVGKGEFKAFGPYKPIQKGQTGGLTPGQQEYLDGLIERYTRRTSGSKAHTQEHRSHNADPRVAAGFRALWKEMVYPIVVERSSGSRLWDIDGNEYIDVLNGFGLTMFGHSPRFVTDAVQAQLEKGVEIGPQTPLAGEVASLICELTGMDRACFCNTGSEAVMAALRVARTVTARDKVVMFAGAYHGTFDEVLVRANHINDKLGSLPIAPGIPQEKVENVLVLEYGAPESLEILKAHADELAAVLVETVQSRRPDLQPREFLQEVRRITEESGTALIFDEVVTGFRVHPGGVQALFNIRADMATYGKVIGGGFPIGVLAGKRCFMDALDGGAWGYGDASFPEVGVTFHAGTFVRHPLAMAAAAAVLNYLKSSGPALQEQLNEKASRFASTLNGYFQENQVPTRVQNFGSVLYFSFPHDLRFASLFYYAMRLRGVHILEGFPCFLTTAHTDTDLDFVIQAFKDSIAELQAVGLLPGGGDEPQPEALSFHAPAETGPALTTFPAGVLKTEAAVLAPNNPGSAPLTEAQKEIWLSAQMGPDASCAYNESCTLRLEGSLDLPTLRESLQDLVRRHAALRTTFSPDGVRQHFASDLTIDLPLVDLSGLNAGPQDDQIRAIVESEGREPFDLLQGPLIRSQVLRLAPDRHQIILTAHHIVCDGWSFGVLLNELGEIYSAKVEKRQPVLEEPLQFGQYVAIQEEESQSPESAQAAAYWKAQFADSVPTLELPTDRPRPPVKSYNGSMERIILGGSLFQDLKKVSAQRKTTLFSTLLSAFQTLLYRLSGQEDLVVGIPAAGQSMVGSSSLVGHCLHFLPLRSRVNQNATFSEYVTGVKRLVLDAYDHQNYTYGTLIQSLDLPRDPSRLPLLSVMFNIDPGGMDAIRFSGMECQVESNAKCFSNMDLFLNIFQTRDELRLECDYNSDLFDRTTIQRWLHSYQTLIEAIVQDPDRKIAEMPLLSAAEERRILTEWNATKAPYPSDRSLHSLIEEQVRRTPEATAVVFEEQTLTYRELDARANQLAHHLGTEGVGTGTLVGLCVERSPDMIAAALGILKAGGAYVPLDPSYPKDRIAFMIEDAGMPVVVTESNLIDRLPEGRARLLCLDREHQTLAQASTEAPGTADANSAAAEDLAYVIYTSGSTGRPKGVQITHRSLINCLISAKERPGLSSGDVLAAVSTLSFDIAGVDMWLPLMVGAQVVIVSRERAMDGAELVAEMNRTHATFLQATPATWRLLLEAGWKAPAGFRMISTGEALPRELADRLLECGTELWNLYGPTETTIWSAVSRVDPGDGPVTVGGPIANTQLYVLDGRMQPVGIGIPGELHIGGDGLARGYLNRPDLTSEKFVPDPFHPEGRLYRTGDLVRYRTDGSLEFLGRIDDQVKIRGFRIELGEIETALNQLPGIHQSTVVAREEGSGNKRLVAYIVVNPNADAEVVERLKQPSERGPHLRRALSSRLPEYMMPAAFVRLEALPLTPSGKVNRRALPAPDWNSLSRNTTFVAPRSHLEEVLAGIWTQVLKLDRVGIHDDLFELGADSLLIFQIATRAHQAGINITPRQMFTHRTIGELAAAGSMPPMGASSIGTPSPGAGENGAITPPPLVRVARKVLNHSDLSR